MDKANTIKQDIFVTSVLAIFSLYILLTTNNYPEEAGAFPKIVSILVIALCILQLVLSSLKLSSVIKSVDNPKEEISKNTTNKTFIITAITLIVYPILIFVIGFIPSTLIYLVYTMYTYGYRNKVRIALISVGVLSVIYIIFEVMLRIKLPIGLMLGGF